MKHAGDDLLDLVTAQLKLARLELAADLRGTLTKVVRIALFMPPLLVGYAFGMAALAAWLGEYWGRPAALAAVAALQIAPAAIGLYSATSALGRARILERTRAEASDSVHRSIAAVTDPPRPPGG